MSISTELQKWLYEREKLIQASRNMTKNGVKITLRAELYNPDFLKEPLKSEALEYFKHNADKVY